MRGEADLYSLDNLFISDDICIMSNPLNTMQKNMEYSNHSIK